MPPHPRCLRALALLIGAAIGLTSPVGTVARAEDHAGGRRNHLAREASPYLQLHVYNPVDWYPWGPEAFARARSEDKPIFLSVGYSTCYWCHVMEREVFSNPEIAALMNESFVSIKVDREERPDVDEVYMQATQLLNGAGGWPNSVFLTPDGRPFFAGTYFPPEDSPGRPGFPSVLTRLATTWRTERAAVDAQADRIASSIAAGFAHVSEGAVSLEPKRLLERSVDALARSFDARHGGFSGGTKFPSPHRLELLLAAHRLKVGDGALEMLTKTLDEMALGGINDHLAGGFHRYCTEPTWSVPHFEKMLYDNAQLLPLYARAYKITKKPLYRRVAEDIATYLAREMTHPQGGFYSAQDAEVDGKEGASYVWTESQIRAVLRADVADDLLSVYELVPVHRGEASGPGALRLRDPIEPALQRLKLADTVMLLDRYAPARAALLARRATRKQPLLDDKVLAAWNGLAIRGLVDAGVELARPEYVARAERAAHFVVARMLDANGRLHRSFVAGAARENAVLDDYAFLADGLVALHSATGDRHWLAVAQQLADRMIADYEGPEGVGFYLSMRGGDTPAEPELFVRPRVLADNVTPAGNTVALRLLRDLSLLTGLPRYQEASVRTQTALSGMFERAPAAVGTAVRSLAVGPQLPAPPLVREEDAKKAEPLPALPTGKDFVSSAIRRGESTARLDITLTIAPGWHVNANPSSLAFLIPTRVELVENSRRAPGRIQVSYPDSSRFNPRFSLEPLAVYEGRANIAVLLPSDLAASARLDLTFQACDETTCLPPEVVPLEIPWNPR